MAYIRTTTLVRARALRRRLTKAETILWSRLRGGIGGMRFRRQHPIGPYIADFACIRARLVLELDGATHGTDEQAHDARREAYLRSQHWRIVRIRNELVYDSLERVLDVIYQHTQS
ncbi:MAG TPA: endonuclease domain-containing protein [Rhizomicrobium sp.]|nr:endonuclease domain-containing protein [Rhizomicrobium sp.]